MLQRKPACTRLATPLVGPSLDQTPERREDAFHHRPRQVDTRDPSV